MNDIVQQKNALALQDDELINVLRNSLYPGAQTDSIKMVLGYCRASGLDPMQKPVHIVPIWDSKLGAMRDVVMPGVGLYRTQASRTGQFAGMTEPVFGPNITGQLGGQTVTYPEWCKVTVKRALASGIIAEFTACEYWIENYAVKGGKEKSAAPNAMWTKRPRGQLSKCAGAQAMRIAFPELGASPTADEMEGKQFDEADIVRAEIKATEKTALPTITAEDLASICKDKTDNEGVIIKMGHKSIVQSNQKTADELIIALSTKYTLTDEIKEIIQSWTPIEAAQ